MAERLTFQEILRIVLGGFRGEIKNFARSIVDYLPESLRVSVVARVIGVLAQIVEKTNIAGFQEIISDAIEIISDEIGKQVKKPEKEKLINLRSMLENIKKRLEGAENIQSEKDRIIEELKALQEIINVFKTLEELIEGKEEEKKPEIDWDEVLNRINKVIDAVKIGGINAWEMIKEIDREARRMAGIIERKRRGGKYDRFKPF